MKTIKDLKIFIERIEERYGTGRAGDLPIELHSQVDFDKIIKWYSTNLTTMGVAEYPATQDRKEELAVVFK